ncbi:MAG: alpha/beta fold hydrolase [Solirubrobacteraceae bacterium]
MTRERVCGSRSRLGATVAGLGVVELVRDGVALAYDDAGAGYPALVFVHGAACNRRFWSQQVPRFCAAHRVIAVDLRGHGESDAPSDTSRRTRATGA